MTTTIINDGSVFTLDEADSVTLIIKHGRSGKTLTYQADTPHGVKLVSMDTDRNIHLSFVVKNMNIKET